MLGVLSASLLLTATAAAQWPSDPAANLPIANRPNDQVQPKIRATSDGGCYISWFDNAAGGYDVYLQRLDAQGYEQWPHNGVLVANRSYSSTTDYDLAVDADDNAILTYNDDRSGSDQIGCNKIAPDGTLLWGPTGVLVTSTTEFVASPKVAVTSTGDYIVGWLQDTSFWLQRLNASGVPQWMPAKHIAPTSGSYLLADLEQAGGGSVIASWVYYTSFSGPKYLYTQKYSASGTPLWGLSPVIVFDGGSLQMGYFPDFVPDGIGGAVYTWYDVAGTRNCYVQHVSSVGVQVFPHNGVAASTLANRIRLSPDVAYNSASGEIFVFWTEADLNQTQWGLYGQRFSSAGSRLWTNSGLQLLPLSTSQNGFVKTIIAGSGATVFYVDNPTTTAHLKAMRVDGAGTLVWPSSPRMVSSLPSFKWDTNVVRTSSGMALVAWVDQRDGSNNIYAQNVNPDGSLGLPAFIVGDLNCDGAVNFGDINPFVLYLANYALWQTTYAGCPEENGDINGDGTYPSFGDINPFVALLTGS
jgi:hypothetical protein